jgi:hypothetical protein
LQFSKNLNALNEYIGSEITLGLKLRAVQASTGLNPYTVRVHSIQVSDKALSGGSQHLFTSKKLMLQVYGWAFELKYDSLPLLDFKEMACILDYFESSSAKLAYKNEHQALSITNSFFVQARWD